MENKIKITSEPYNGVELVIEGNSLVFREFRHPKCYDETTLEFKMTKEALSSFDLLLYPIKYHKPSNESQVFSLDFIDDGKIYTCDKCIVKEISQLNNGLMRVEIYLIKYSCMRTPEPPQQPVVIFSTALLFAQWLGEKQYSKHQCNDRWYDDGEYIGSTADMWSWFENDVDWHNLKKALDRT